MRVFLGPVEIAGYYSALADGLRSIGVDAVNVDITGHQYRYRQPDGHAPIPVRLATWAYVQMSSRSVLRPLWRSLFLVSKAVLGVWAIARFDVFVFGYRRSLFGLRELRLLRMLRKRVIFVLHGSDARPAYLDGALFDAASDAPIGDVVSLAAKQKSDLRRIERWASAVVAHPLYAHFLERPYVRFLALGIPVAEVMSQGNSPRHGPVRVVHAPSHPAAKGSAAIEAAIRNLQARGFEIDFVELRGVSNAVVRDELAKCDFVVDQLYSDTAMAGLAVEAAWHGKPSIVGSYGWDDMKRLIPEDELGPVLQCQPEEIEAAIATLISDEAGREKLGRSAHAFAARRASSLEVGRLYLQLIRRQFPIEWMSDPRDTQYRYGSGLPADVVRGRVGAVVHAAGRAGLQLDDKPELADALVRWASANEASS